MTPSTPLRTGVRIEAVSAPQFRTTLTHGPSGSRLDTEAPKDNGGTGASFSPTDLLASSLLSCAITTMALAAARENLPLGAVQGTVEKIMSTEGPRRVAELVLELRMPTGLSTEQRRHFEEIARGCPVRRSLHPDVKISERFTYLD